MNDDYFTEIEERAKAVSVGADTFFIWDIVLQLVAEVKRLQNELETQQTIAKIHADTIRELRKEAVS